MGTDEEAIRDILKGKSKAEIDAAGPRSTSERYGHDLRGRLDDELDGREQVELLDQAFDRGKIDPDAPSANAERLRRLREQQDVEKGDGLWLTDEIQQTRQGRVRRAAPRPQRRTRRGGGRSGDEARAGQLLGLRRGRPRFDGQRPRTRRPSGPPPARRWWPPPRW